jgi:microcin C transport system permease protein
MALFGASLFAELIANDKPLLVVHANTLYFPVFKAYPETEFGGQFETEADYRDPFTTQLIADHGGWILWPMVRFSHNTID